MELHYAVGQDRGKENTPARVIRASGALEHFLSWPADKYAYLVFNKLRYIPL